MRTSSPTRLIALLPLVVGLAATGLLVHARSQGLERDLERAQTQDLRLLQAIANDVRHHLAVESAQLEAAMRIVADEVDAADPGGRLPARSLGSDEGGAPGTPRLVPLDAESDTTSFDGSSFDGSAFDGSAFDGSAADAAAGGPRAPEPPPDQAVSNRIEGILDNLRVLDRDRGVVAVLAWRGDHVIVVADASGVLPGDMPDVPGGLAMLDDPRWAGDLAYGLDLIGEDQQSEVVMILESGIINENLAAHEANGITVRLTGPVGTGMPPTDLRGWDRVGSSLWVEPASNAAALLSDATFLGSPVSIEVVASERTEVDGAVGADVLLTGGVLFSLLLAAATLMALHRIDRLGKERDRALVAERVSTARFWSGFTQTPIGVVEVGNDGHIVAVNSRFARQLGYMAEQLNGVELVDLVDGEDRAEAAATLYRVLSGEVDDEHGERRYRTRNGAAVWVRESVCAVSDEDGVRHALVHAEDVSEERRARAESHRRALFDSLTGLPNRANLMARLNRAIETERGPGELVAVLSIDLNDFKAINDELGFEAGDLILMEVADRLRRASRSSDTVARLSGDEFVVVCEGVPGVKASDDAADRFAAVLGDPVFFQGKEVRLSASIGMVVSADPASSDEMLRQAEQALLEAKTCGQGVVRQGWTPEHGSTVTAPSVTEGELRAALDENQLRLAFQPIRLVPEGAIVGFEALLRWEHPTKGLLAPGAFLGLAEELSLLPRIDAWALSEGMAALGRFSRRVDGADDWYLVFNIAPVNFNNRSFAVQVAGYAADAGIDLRRIVLERNETWFMNQTPGAVLTTRELRALGVRISLDHYGTATGPSGDLSDLEFDFLKIDRSFVRDARERSTSVLEAIRNMAEALDLKVIAEGIETSAELAVVRKAGIRYAQGYHLGRPMAEDAVLAIDEPVSLF